MVRKAFCVDLSLNPDGGFLQITQVKGAADKPPYITVGAYKLTYEEWNELCGLGPLLVTPHVSPKAKE